MKIRTILTEILVSTLLISIIPLIAATFFNLKSTQKITKDMIYKYQDTLIANLQETEVSRVKSLAKEINILFSGYINTLSSAGSIIKALNYSELDEALENINSSAQSVFSVIESGSDPELTANISRYGIYIEHLDLYESNNEIFSYFCFYTIADMKDKNEVILKMCSNLYTPFEEIFSQDYRQSTVFVVDQNGFAVYHSNRDIMIDRQYMGNQEVVETALLGMGSGSITYHDQNRENIFGAFANVSMFNLNWGIISQSPIKTALFYVKRLEEESRIQISEIIYVSLTILMTTMVAVAMVSYILAKRLSNPIMLFEQKSRSIADGEYSQMINIKSKNEIGSLANTFNLMTRKIKEYIVQLEKAAKDNEELFFQSIQALASSIDAKDPYTKGHSERVTRYSVAIAFSLGLPPNIIKKVKIAALLHDVGKIGIVDSILQKPGILDDEEYREMQKHPIYGANIMGSITKLHDIIPGMKHHHEKWDGSGYPDKIRGELIPLEARIIAIADTFDAMTTDRPYQNRWDPDDVLAKVIEWSGTKYDPKIVIAFENAYYESIRRNFHEEN